MEQGKQRHAKPLTAMKRLAGWLILSPSRWLVLLSFPAVLILLVMVRADPFPPFWEGGTGTAIHYQPVVWPTDDGDGELDNGDWTPYTMIGADIQDPKVQDPSNGGTSPQNYVNISSGCTDLTLPSTFTYFDATSQVLMFRWRVEQIAHTYATGPNAGTASATDPWKSGLWTVLIDIDGDGYREFAIHLDGSSGSPGTDIDRIASIYSDTPNQSIDYVNDSNICLLEHNPTAFVDGPTPDGNTNRILNFQNSLTPTASWPNGNSESVWDYGTTRAVEVDHGTCIEYFVDYQIPLAMLNATASACNGPQVTEDTPISLLFATANSLNNPLQKDVVLFGDYIGDPDAPAPFGDPITPGGGPLPQPVISAVTAASCGPATLTATVTDSTQVSGGSVVDSIATVDFYYYADTNANGQPDDGSSWTPAAGATSPSLGTWTASWDSTNLAQGQYLIGVRAEDDQGNVTWSHLTAAQASPDFANPTPDPGVVFATFVNTCGSSPTASKGANASAVTAGDPVQFTITVNASLVSPLSVSQIDDVLPPGWIFVSTDGGTLTPATSSPTAGQTGTVSWTFAPATVIAAGGSGTIVFTASASTVVGTYTNVANATTDQGTVETNPVEVAVGAPQLTIAKSADVASADPGDPVTYTITYSNDASVTVTNAVITDALPLGLTFVSAANGGVHDGGTPGTITWNIGTIAAGDGPFAVSFTATVDNPYPALATVPLVNTGTIDSDQTSPLNADASVFVNVPRPSLAIQKDGDVTQVLPGNNVVYTITYVNTGNADATSVVITDPVPAGFTFVSATGGGTHDSGSPGIVTWNVGTVAAGGTGSVMLTLQATASAANPTTNTATITGTGITPVFDDYDVGITQGACAVPTTYYFKNATADVGFAGTRNIANTTAPTSATPTVTSTVSVGPASAGRTELLRFYQDPPQGSAFDFSQAVTATVYVDKSGSPQAIFWLTLFDYDPVTGTETQLATASTSVQGNKTNEPAAFNLGTPTLTVPETHRLLWVVEGTNGHGGQTNDVAVRYDGTGSPSASDICTSPITLTLDKQVDVLSAGPGDTLVYTLKYANTGQGSVTNAVLTDTLPVGVSFDSALPVAANCTESLGVVTCNLGTVAGGTSGTVTITVTVSQPLAAGIFSLQNDATLDSLETEPVNDSATTTIVRPVLGITKSADDTLLIQGDTVTYTLEITNSGSASAASVLVSDSLPVDTYFSYVGSSCSVDISLAPSTSSTTCGEAAGVVTATADVLAVGETLRIAFQMTVGAGPAPAGLTVKDNFASASDDNSPSVSSNTVTVTISTNPNLQLAKSSNPAAGPLDPGDPVTYTLVLGNTGSTAADDVLVVDPIPANTSYVLGSLIFQAVTQTDPDDVDTGHFDAVGNRAVFDIGSLAAGASRTMSFQVTVDSPLPNGTTPVDNTATATASNTATKQASANLTASAAPNLTLTKTAPATLAFPLTMLSATVTASVTINVDDADLIGVNDYVSVNGTGARVTAKTGNTLTLDTAVTGSAGDNVNPVIAFVLRYENTGNANATNVSVTDSLPTNTVFVAADSGGTHDAGSPGTVSWSLGTVPAGGAGSLKFWARPTVAGTYNNNGTIDSDETSPTNSNTTVTTIGALQPTKVTSTPSVTNPGAQATYTISVFNGTGSLATAINITDEMEKGFSFASNVGFNITGGTGGSRTSTTDPTSGDNPATWCCWDLSAGATLDIQYLANLSDEVGDGTYQNNVTVDSQSSSHLLFDFLATTQEDVTVNWIGPNHVVLSWIEAFYEQGLVVVQWQTDAEVRTSGFYLKRYRPETDRYEAVHEDMLPSVVGSPQGGTYRVVDEDAPLGGPLSYVLLEIENNGKERSYGPFSLEVRDQPSLHVSTAGGTTRPGFHRTPRSRSPRNGLNRSTAALESRRVARRGGSRGLKIAVDESGLYRVEVAEITEALGLKLGRAARLLRKHRLRLSVDGARIPYLIEGRGNTSALLFYGEGFDSVYASHRTYRLSTGRSKRIASVSGYPDGVAFDRQTFRDTVRFEEDHVPLVLGEVDGDSDFWFWDYVIAGDTPKIFPIDVRGVAPTTTEAILRVFLRGAVDTGAGVHQVRVLFNGELVGHALLEGFDGGAFSFAIPAFLLREGANTVELEGVPQPDVPYSIVYCDSLSLVYERTYQAHNAALLARSEDKEVLSIGGFPEPDVRVLDITDPLFPREVRGVVTEVAPLDGYRVRFASVQDAKYLAVSASGVRKPASLRWDYPSRLRNRKNSADYLIITSAELAPTAKRLAAHRAGQGHRTMTIDLDDIMDEFNAGNFDPRAIRSFLAHAYARWRKPPRYVALVGEGTYDYKDIRGFGNNHVPPLMVGGSWGLYGADNRLADLVGDDGVPEIAIGRIPVENAEQLEAYIDKLIAYEQNDDETWTRQVLLAADNPDDTGDYPADSEDYAALLPEELVANRVYLGQLTAEEGFELLIANLNEGVSLMTYLGHAGITQLSNEALLRSADVPNLTNGDRLPVIAVMGCHLGNFWLPGYSSLAEDLVLHPDGGAAGVWSPAGLSYNPQRRILGEAYLRAVYEEGIVILGDAVLRALAVAATQHASGRREVLETQVLLGDPALRLKSDHR